VPEAFLYLTTRGRTTGLPRTIEIWFVELSGRWYVVSEGGEAANWVKNLVAEPRVSFSTGPRHAREALRPAGPALARPLREPDAAETLRAVRAAMDAKYGWSEGLVVQITPER
jgi:deazaflavin-dependent oxidoreductase (nitroreductase family)